MKKNLFIILVVMVNMSLVACSKKDNKNVEDGASQSIINSELSNNDAAVDMEKQSQKPDNDFTVSQNEGLKGLYTNSSCGTENGYYYLTDSDTIGDDIYGKHLMYIDYATKQEIYLCSDSGCRHNSENCSAVFSDEKFGDESLLFVHNGFLYLLSKDYDADNSQSIDFSGDGSAQQTENKNVVLYRMGLDGQKREKVFTFPDNMTLENLVIEDNDNLWFITKELTFQYEDNVTYTSSQNKALSKLDMSKNEITDTIPLDFGDSLSYDVIGADGSCFVLRCVEFSNGMTDADTNRLDNDEWIAAFKNSSTVCFTLDVNSHNKKEIYHVSNSSGNALSYAIKNGIMYVTDNENGGILKIDLNSGEQSRLNSSSNNFIVHDFSDSLGCWSEENDGTWYFTDMESGEEKHCTLTNVSLGWHLELMAETEDKFLVVYDYDATPSEYNDGAYEIEKYKYALISKSDLYDSIGNYEPISMVGRGF